MFLLNAFGIKNNSHQLFGQKIRLMAALSVAFSRAFSQVFFLVYVELYCPLKFTFVPITRCDCFSRKVLPNKKKDRSKLEDGAYLGNGLTIANLVFSSALLSALRWEPFMGPVIYRK